MAVALMIQCPYCIEFHSQDNRTWHLTGMGSSTGIIGDATTDEPLKTVSALAPGSPLIRYPHGVTVYSGINRVLVTSTVRPSDIGDPGETVTVLEASSGRYSPLTRSPLNPPLRRRHR